jgi:hypothetical protein
MKEDLLVAFWTVVVLVALAFIWKAVGGGTLSFT